MKSELTILAAMAAAYVACVFLPVEWAGFWPPLAAALELVRDYARAHVLWCLVPAFFIAGGIANFVGQASVMKYLGAAARKVVAYGVASVSGSVLAVCSCTVLPLFAGIYRMGAGLGPATAFLYSGPAVNVLAIALTWQVLGWQLGLARLVGAVGFSVVIGLLMHLIYRKEERAKAAAQAAMPAGESPRPLWKTTAFFATMVAILVLANWARSGDVRAVFLCCPDGLTTYEVEGQVVARTGEHVVVRDAAGRQTRIPRGLIRQELPGGRSKLLNRIHEARWLGVAAVAALLGAILIRWFTRAELRSWAASSWGLAKQILPLLLVGVLVAGVLLGSPSADAAKAREGRSPIPIDRDWSLGLIPRAAVQRALGGNSVWANLLAAVGGALMYFATLTEVPILSGLLGAGMGKGPALALLLAGPAVSLPNMLVIRSVMGTGKTLVYVGLVVVMATACGLAFGAIAAG